ncbi:MAG TPA: DUF5989 family protein [Pirellulales bacterium]|jgi:hypothetical protein|nr:DUF5989 family protein [Pirellulales bacterium]
MSGPDDHRSTAERFAEDANRRRPSALGEFVLFLRHNKKWWLTPIVIMLLLVGLLVILSSTAAAPFIYTLF